jgi:RNA polymerase sigma-B factor
MTEMEVEPARSVARPVAEPERDVHLVRPGRDVPPARVAEQLDAESRLQRTREDRRLLLRYHEHGDTAAREELVERFLPLARQLARRYQRTNEPLDDLMQVASVGLVKAIDRFDPARGTAFSTYAVPTILGELKRYFRDSGWAVHVPRGMQERVMKLDTTAQELHRKLGRSPSPKELATELELSEEEVLEAMEAASAYDAVSLEQQRSDTDNGSSSDTFQDKLGTEEERYELVEYGATIAPTLKALSPRERLILHLRFVEDMTQSEIAERIGVSQMHVSRLIRRSLARLRNPTGES